ncbi:MAG TPA: hypothetical protein VNS60_12220 [Solirubrobacterales bacterium]|nr:hypothetical protein [Solirubrobacterales bacterium]
MGGKARLKPVAAALLAATALATHFGPAAIAEVSQKDGVRVSVSGSMRPSKLPRTGSKPIAVSVAGKIVATKAGALPKLSAVSVAINQNGRFNTKGIPLCRLGHINPSTTQEALIACRPALIGEGSFSADVRIPDQSPFPSQGKILAFNGKLRGKPAIFAHIYGTKPVPTSYVLPFTISQAKGTYGTILQASLPSVTGEWGYVTGISLSLDQKVMSAACPAPAGFTKAVFPLARTAFSFDGGLTLTSTLSRTCRVAS